METLLVAGTSKSGHVAGAIAAIIRKGEDCKLEAIGANTVYLAICAIAIARELLAKEGIEIAFSPSFGRLEPDKTKIVLKVTKQ